jgi:hypothetical protein
VGLCFHYTRLDGAVTVNSNSNAYTKCPAASAATAFAGGSREEVEVSPARATVLLVATVGLLLVSACLVCVLARLLVVRARGVAPRRLTARLSGVERGTAPAEWKSLPRDEAWSQ